MQYIPFPSYWGPEISLADFVNTVIGMDHVSKNVGEKWEAYWTLGEKRVIAKRTNRGIEVNVRKGQKIIGQAIEQDPINAAISYDAMKRLFNRKNGQRR